MNDDEFEWDDLKAADNYAKHGVSFEAARDAFKIHSPLNESMTAKRMARIATPSLLWWKDACCMSLIR
jgi:uncharacterized DUF497 family protein